MVEGTDMQRDSMEEIMIKAHRAGNVALFNHAASAWNHNFFFRCLSPTGGGQPDVDLLAQIDKDFGSLDRLKGEVISFQDPGSELLIYYCFR